MPQHSKIRKVSILKPAERAWVHLKNGTRDFQNNPPFEVSTCFNVKDTGNLERFQYFNFEANFLKIETFFKKLGEHFLVESTKVEK